MASALTSAASSSTRPSPKLWRAEGGRAAIHDASSARPSAAPSVTMWPASASSASEPPRQPAIGLDQRVGPGQRQRQQQALALLRRSGRGMTVMMFVRSGVHSLRLLVVRKKQAADVSCRRPPRTGFTDQPT
jgi:hypothetical protein